MITLVVAAVTLFVALRVDTTPPTEVITIRPFGSGGFLVVEPVSTREGICELSIISNRADALRCFLTDHGVVDPCFRSPSAVEPDAVVCLEDHSELTFQLVTVSRSLPPLDLDVEPSADEFLPFVLFLDNGNACFASTGAGPFAAGFIGERFYACPNDSAEFSAQGVDSDNPIWTVHLFDDVDGVSRLARIARVLR